MPRRAITRLVRLTLAILGCAALLGGAFVGRTLSRIPDLFRLNKACQEEGYFMAEFEFKMLGIGYLLDHGHYRAALSRINALHDQLETRKGLVKVPAFADKSAEMEFYLGLQNPRTGAFMDDGYPYCTWEGPTGNVLQHLEGLARVTGRPLALRYPLTFLELIDTPQELRTYLDDLSRIGWMASRLPESSFHFVRDLLSYAGDENLVERHRLFVFSPEWKRALLRWVYENQDPESGYWGPRFRRSGRLTKLDLHNTSSITKAFVDNEGNDRYREFPLRYRRQMFETTVQVMSGPPPSDWGDLDEWHAWSLRQGKGIALLTRHLWRDLPQEDRARARTMFESLIRSKYQTHYVRSEGAFSYYPGSQRATLDGTGSALAWLDDAGSFSPEKQRRIWGAPEKTCVDLGRVSVEALSEKELAPLVSRGLVNAFRYYSGEPHLNEVASDVAGAFYTRETPILDLAEIAPALGHWADSTKQSLGNWTSRQDILDQLSRVPVGAVPVFRHGAPLDRLNDMLGRAGSLTVVGFDTLQVPVCRMTFVRARCGSR